jgi:hypothetical protein
MKKTKSTDSPLVELKIPLKKFIKMIETRFNARIQKIEVDINARKQVQKALESAITSILSEKFVVEGTVVLVQFPLGSMAASNKFSDPDAGQIVYVMGTGKHKPYIRKWVNPPEPKSVKQLDRQKMFKQVNEQWKNESVEIKTLWDQYAKKLGPATGQTQYIKRWFAVGKETGVYPGLGFRP